MDGASKFVRGDAIAGILIMVINIVGGLFIGVMMHGLPMGEAAKTYTLLTIGDGLVAQIPGLMLSVAVAIIVTRVTREQDMGGELQKQLFGQPNALGVAAAVLGIMGVIPGMPNIAFLSIAACAVSPRGGRQEALEAAAPAASQPLDLPRRCASASRFFTRRHAAKSAQRRDRQERDVRHARDQAHDAEHAAATPSALGWPNNCLRSSPPMSCSRVTRVTMMATAADSSRPGSAPPGRRRW